MKTKNLEYITNPLVQKMFIILGLGYYFAQAMTSYEIINSLVAREYFSNGLRFSQIVLVVIEATLLPVLLFLIAFYLIPKNKPLLQRIFESSFYGVMGALLQIIVVQLFDLLLSVFRVVVNFQLPTIAPMLITTSLVILTYIIAMVYFKRSNELKSGISMRVQKIFILLILGAFLAHAITTIYRIAQQYPSNPNLSGFFSSLVEYLALPIILFSIVYLLSASRMRLMSRLFQSLIFTVMGMMLLLVAQSLLRYGNMNMFLSLNINWGHFAYNLMTIIVVIVIYTGTVLYLRKSQRV